MSMLDRMETGDWPRIRLPESSRAQATQILNTVVGEHGLTLDNVRGDSRIRKIVLCRREAAWRIARDTRLALTAIARLLNKDHTTIIFAIRRANEACQTNVRNLGIVSPEHRERQRAASQAKRQKARTRQQKMRRAELYHLSRQGLEQRT